MVWICKNSLVGLNFLLFPIDEYFFFDSIIEIENFKWHFAITMASVSLEVWINDSKLCVRSSASFLRVITLSAVFCFNNLENIQLY